MPVSLSDSSRRKRVKVAKIKQRALNLSNINSLLFIATMLMNTSSTSAKNVYDTKSNLPFDIKFKSRLLKMKVALERNLSAPNSLMNLLTCN